MGKITESTTISIGLVIILIGGVFWLSTLYANDMTQNQKIAELHQENKEIKDDIKKILNDTYEIKADLKILTNNKRK